MSEYLFTKFFHILIAVLALGTSAGLGILLELYGDHPTHGAYVLGAIKRLVTFFVIPGYLLTLVTGLWMAHLSWPLTTTWIQAALALWGIGIVALMISQRVLTKQLRLFESTGPGSSAYRRTSLLGRVLGAATGLLVLAILYLMVFKPGT